ncbi:hypothetical protein COO60DRAFT_682933 [Scenedesmus sp. NREL 46B-D3]|nr:hypothetical protein COO60DRAFT_682933 [Scenedesmus sp. NREL 46B-D3]
MRHTGRPAWQQQSVTAHARHPLPQHARLPRSQTTQRLRYCFSTAWSVVCYSCFTVCNVVQLQLFNIVQQCPLQTVVDAMLYNASVLYAVGISSVCKVVCCGCQHWNEHAHDCHDSSDAQQQPSPHSYYSPDCLQRSGNRSSKSHLAQTCNTAGRLLSAAAAQPHTQRRTAAAGRTAAF